MGGLDDQRGFWQDDLYAEIPLMQALADHGVDCDVKTVGEYFRDTSFALFHANLAARINLRAGIDAPMSGHYLYNDHSDDIDWQIEADFVGQSCRAWSTPLSTRRGIWGTS